MVLFYILDLVYSWNGFMVSVFRRNFQVSLSVGISEVRSVQSVNLGLPVIARFESETVNPHKSSGFLKLKLFKKLFLDLI